MSDYRCPYCGEKPPESEYWYPGKVIYKESVLERLEALERRSENAFDHRRRHDRELSAIENAVNACLPDSIMDRMNVIEAKERDHNSEISALQGNLHDASVSIKGPGSRIAGLEGRVYRARS